MRNVSVRKTNMQRRLSLGPEELDLYARRRKLRMLSSGLCRDGDRTSDNPTVRIANAIRESGAPPFTPEEAERVYE